MRDSAEELAEQLLAAQAAGAMVRIRAGGSKDFFGNTATLDRTARPVRILDPRMHSGVVQYQPGELVLSARAGTPLAELEQLLAAQRQMFGFEPPHFAAGSTLGGCVGAGLSGPRRMSAGSAHGGVRDQLLGVRMLDGRGRSLRFGGTVMKNVAGYDVSRLMAGSLGTLGLLLEISLKVFPRPAEECTLELAMPQGEALQAMQAWRARPLPVSATAWCDDVLRVRLSGAAAAVRAARSELGGQQLEAGRATEFWAALRDQRLPYFSGSGVLWRLSLPAALPPLELAGPQLLEWSGMLRWWRGEADAGSLRQRIGRMGGHATRFRGGDVRVPAFPQPPPALLQLQRRVREQFDPNGLFDGARLYPEL